MLRLDTDHYEQVGGGLGGGALLGDGGGYARGVLSQSAEHLRRRTGEVDESTAVRKSWTSLLEPWGIFHPQQQGPLR